MLTIKKFLNLNPNSRKCINCKKMLTEQDIEAKDYVLVVDKYKRYILSHKKCFYEYLKEVKNGMQ